MPLGVVIISGSCDLMVSPIGKEGLVYMPHIPGLHQKNHALEDVQGLQRAVQTPKLDEQKAEEVTPHDVGPAAIAEISKEGVALSAKAGDVNADAKPVLAPTEKPGDVNADAKPVLAPTEKPVLREEAEKPSSAVQPAVGDQEDGAPVTVSSDQNVDQEVSRLKQRKQKLQSSIQQIADPSEKASVKQQVQQLEEEIKTKDSETYRKNHAKYWQE